MKILLLGPNIEVHSENPPEVIFFADKVFIPANCEVAWPAVIDGRYTHDAVRLYRPATITRLPT